MLLLIANREAKAFRHFYREMCTDIHGIYKSALLSIHADFNLSSKPIPVKV